MTEREIVSRLREEYFDILPAARRAITKIETEIRYHTLEIHQRLKPHEQLLVRARIKECQSAIDSARRRGNRGKSEGKVFDPERSTDYSILSLPDLAGVRVLVFPDRRLGEVDKVLREHFSGWRSDPIMNSETGVVLAQKYDGKLDVDKDKISAEYQVVPMLLGLYWEVEHSARYKSVLKESEKMFELNTQVETALSNFEKGIADLLPDNSDLD
uniref:RelA/SpoT domain-containing protein n=1 Tax=mine drainage metagenome TaxID=410659 RepID=E6QKF1_9ZZZZ